MIVSQIAMGSQLLDISSFFKSISTKGCLSWISTFFPAVSLWPCPWLLQHYCREKCTLTQPLFFILLTMTLVHWKLQKRNCVSKISTKSILAYVIVIFIASQLAAQRALYLPPLYVSNYYASTYMNDFASISNTALQTRAKCRSYASGLHSGPAFNIGFP